MLQTSGNLDVALALVQATRRGMKNPPTPPTRSVASTTRKGAPQSVVDMFQEALRLEEGNKAAEGANITTWDWLTKK